ncbi:hypothetical protein D9757_000997 [Collybiopsis confluens]|uniref:DUF6598 domain-containing protein n=1 Tax=Collybiopsis confluens TaxID=2823264 RepID=A0A8H5I0I4_9AGAR|nr:hypothetical protein D9757_000997 [Collybiopsis confluens]
MKITQHPFDMSGFGAGIKAGYKGETYSILLLLSSTGVSISHASPPTNETNYLGHGHRIDYLLMVLPTEFNFDKGAREYFKFIQQIRDNLPATTSVHSVPILSPARTPLRTFDLKLTSGGSTVHVRLQTHNLYVIGFSRDGIEWFEVDHPGSNGALIDGSTSLHFLGSYDSLSGAGNRRLEEVPLSGVAITTAIGSLAHQNTPTQGVARAIMSMAVIISEAVRFVPVSTRIRDSWLVESTVGASTIDNYGDLSGLIRCWGRASNAVQRPQQTGQRFELTNRPLPTMTNIETTLAVLGVMLWALGNGSGAGLARSERSVTAVATIKGQPLLEIFYLRIDKIEGDDPCDLYGTVKVNDSANTETIWEHDKHHTISTKSGTNIVFEGPSRPLYAADAFSIDVDLWDWDPLSDDGIAKGTITFNPFDYFTKYDVANSIPLSADSGSATVNYVALSNALYAMITVILIKGGGENDPEVYGDITAYNGHGTSALFHKTESENFNVNVGTAIPLSRKVVAVPVNGKLQVSALLWDHDPLSDDKIADGAVEFEPLYNKSSPAQRIQGDSDGEIEVRVSWMILPN